MLFCNLQRGISLIQEICKITLKIKTIEEGKQSGKRDKQTSNMRLVHLNVPKLN